MLEPKRIAADAVPAALERALRYRLLNEPQEAESICRDVLAVDADNREARITLLLALTDQFDRRMSQQMDAALELAEAMEGEYEQHYYRGIIYERWGKSHLGGEMPEDCCMEWLRKALPHFERAAELSRPSDPDAVLRWNACVRALQRSEGRVSLAEIAAHDMSGEFGDEVPPR